MRTFGSLVVTFYALLQFTLRLVIHTLQPLPPPACGSTWISPGSTYCCGAFYHTTTTYHRHLRALPCWRLHTTFYWFGSCRILPALRFPLRSFFYGSLVLQFAAVTVRLDLRSVRLCGCIHARYHHGLVHFVLYTTACRAYTTTITPPRFTTTRLPHRLPVKFSACLLLPFSTRLYLRAFYLVPTVLLLRWFPLRWSLPGSSVALLLVHYAFCTSPIIRFAAFPIYTPAFLYSPYMPLFMHFCGREGRPATPAGSCILLLRSPGSTVLWTVSLVGCIFFATIPNFYTYATYWPFTYSTPSCYWF